MLHLIGEDAAHIIDTVCVHRGMSMAAYLPPTPQNTQDTHLQIGPNPSSKLNSVKGELNLRMRKLLRSRHHGLHAVDRCTVMTVQ